MDRKTTGKTWKPVGYKEGRDSEIIRIKTLFIVGCVVVPARSGTGGRRSKGRYSG